MLLPLADHGEPLCPLPRGWVLSWKEVRGKVRCAGVLIPHAAEGPHSALNPPSGQDGGGARPGAWSLELCVASCTGSYSFVNHLFYSFSVKCPPWVPVFNTLSPDGDAVWEAVETLRDEK